MRSIKNKGASGCNGGMIIVIIYIYMVMKQNGKRN